MEEHIFLNEENYKVTNTRFIVNADVYVISQITSIKFSEGLNQITASAFIMGGVSILLAVVLKIASIGSSSAFFGLGFIFLVFAIVKRKFRNKDYKIDIGFSSGVRQEITETNRILLEKVAKALNDAIIFRG